MNPSTLIYKKAFLNHELFQPIYVQNLIFFLEQMKTVLQVIFEGHNTS